jgi:hypothetical protein
VTIQVPLHKIAPRTVLVTTIALIVAVTALLGRIGADAQWLAALGHVIATRHSIPAGIPFAATPTGHWPNALVLAELVFDGLERGLGDRGLMLAQVVAVMGALVVLARDARAGGAEPIGISAALLIASLGAISSLAIVRVQLFSLLLFGALVALLRAQTRNPSRAVWWVVPLLALWSNLHGAALVGLGLVMAYLVLERGRRRPLEAIAVGAASVVALCLTPALANTPAYYAGVMTNLAAQRGQGMWGPLSLTSPFDLILLAAALVLIWGAWRTRLALWEWCVIAASAVLTVHADRNGVWLMFVLVAPAARVLAPERSLRALVPLVVPLSALALVLGLARGPAPSGASPTVITDALSLAHGTPVLADGSIDEQVALAGGRIWAGDPIDAFSRPVQAAYLNWLAGDADGRSALAPAVRVVLVGRGTQTQALMARLPRFESVGGDRTTAMYERMTG